MKLTLTLLLALTIPVVADAKPHSARTTAAAENQQAQIHSGQSAQSPKLSARAYLLYEIGRAHV